MVFNFFIHRAIIGIVSSEFLIFFIVLENGLKRVSGSLINNVVERPKILSKIKLSLAFVFGKSQANCKMRKIENTNFKRNL